MIGASGPEWLDGVNRFVNVPNLGANVISATVIFLAGFMFAKWQSYKQQSTNELKQSSPKLILPEGYEQPPVITLEHITPSVSLRSLLQSLFFALGFFIVFGVIVALTDTAKTMRGKGLGWITLTSFLGIATYARESFPWEKTRRQRIVNAIQFVSIWLGIAAVLCYFAPNEP